MPKNKSVKVIVDTNLWISFIISNKLSVLDPLLYDEKVRLLFSTELISEIVETITKPKLKKYFKGNALDEMLLRFDPFIDLIEIKSTVKVCRDSKDNFLLALAKDGKADYLLTGDKDLLALITFGETKIRTIGTFFNEVKTRR